MAVKNLTLYFHDPRLEMTHAGRLFVRVVFYATYGILIAACLAFFLSDVRLLSWTGVLLFLILMDRAKHFGQADRSFVKDPLKGEVNLARYLTPSSFSIL